MNKHIISALCLTVLSFLSLRGQDIQVNPKFGAVSDTELDMKTYDRDTSAAALLLFRKTEIAIRFDSEFDFTRIIKYHDRWKILKEGGRKCADYEFIYKSGDKSHAQYIYGIKASTFNREDNGKISVSKMSKKFIFDEPYSKGLRRLSFAPENVRVGSVVDVVLEMSEPTVNIGDIPMQWSYPVNLMDLDVSYAEYFTYNRAMRGALKIDFSTEQSTALGTGGFSYNMKHDLYHAVNVPAVHKESFSFCPGQYKSSVVYNISSFSIPGIVNNNYNSSWSEVDGYFFETPLLKYCKKNYKDAGSLKQEWDACADDVQRIALVRNHIVSKVRWNDDLALLPDDPSTVLKKGQGNSADINALTASALNTLGFVAEPVLVRLRSSGHLMSWHISSNSFDTFVLRVMTPDGHVHYLDACRDNAYVDVLAPDYLVEKARLLTFDNNGSWVNLLDAQPKSSLTETVQTRFDEDGVFRGDVQIQALNHDAYNLRLIKDKFATDEERIEDIEKDEKLTVLHIDDVGKEYSNEADISYSFEQEEVRLGGDFVYIRPILSSFHEENSFRDPERKIPVDFPYKSQIKYIFSMVIPDGYAVESLPDPVWITCPTAGGMSVRIQYNLIGNKLHGVFLFNNPSMIVMPEYYPDFQMFWSSVAKAEKAIIILKKQ